MATRKKDSPEEIVWKLQQANRLSAEGATVTETCRQPQVAEPTYCKWRNQGGFNRLSQHFVLQVFAGEKAGSLGSCLVREDVLPGR